MTTAQHPFRWRRVVALGAASALLHYALIGWGTLHLAAPGALEPAMVVAELHAAPAPQPAATPAPAGAPEAGAANSLAPVQLPSPPRATTTALRYKVSLPPPAELFFDVERIDAGGAPQAGQAFIDWAHGGGRYRLTVHTEVAGSAAQELVSEGAAGAAGIVPRTLSAQRGAKAGTATHFDVRRGRVTFSAAEGSVPMLAGTQDKASLPLQLAAIARAGARQLDADIAILVGEEKDADVMRFAVVGQEQLETRIGKLATWHLSQRPEAGTYKARLDIWLAPGHEWYPVQLRSTEANRAVTTRTISKIVPK